MPCKPLGDRPLTNAERQARHRAARAASRPVIRYRPAVDRRSRAQRWRDAVAELVTLQSEYAAMVRGIARKPSRERHRRGIAGDRRSRPRRTDRHRATAWLRTRLRRRCEPRPRLAHGGPQGTSHALLCQTREGRCAMRGSLLWTPWTNRSAVPHPSPITHHPRGQPGPRLAHGGPRGSSPRPKIAASLTGHNRLCSNHIRPAGAPPPRPTSIGTAGRLRSE